MSDANSYDCIVIGTGVAGLTAALALAPRARVLVLTKDALEESATRYAQGGIAAALGADDSAAAHLQDTLAAGAGLVDRRAATILTAAAADRIAELDRLGMPIDRATGISQTGSAIALGREAAHSANRIVHAGGDATGAHLEHTLAERLRCAGVALREYTLATSIVVEGGRAAGVATLDCRSGASTTLLAPAVVLACGGAGQLYRYTTNPVVATGDGIALAYRAGAEVMDLEFVQFHPTALRMPNAPSFLISEAARGEGGLLRDGDGRRFLLDLDPRAELAPRDVVARGIHGELVRSGADHVFLDLTHLPAELLHRRFPQIERVCRDHGLEITRDPLPVAPAAHYTMGGVRTTTWGESSLPGLFACGEVACTGVHGANRLASNSLLEGLVFGARVAERILAGGSQFAPTWGAIAPPAHAFGAAKPTLTELQRLLWEQAGIVRSGEGLAQARTTLANWQRGLPPPSNRAEHELANLVLVGSLVVEAALERRESRGAHFRTDYPETAATGSQHYVLSAEVRHAA